MKRFASFIFLRIRMLAALSAVLFVCAPAAAIEPTTVAKRVEPSMVRVTIKGPVRSASASGFVVSADGHVATTYHIVRPHIERSWELFVAESGAAADVRRPATIVKAYPGEDLAILKVEGLDRRPVILSEATVETPPRGMTIFALGYPGAGGRLGADSGTSFTAGMANRLFEGAWTPQSPRIRIIQHSAATNPGNSGGPVVNPCGQVVGVNTEREIAMIAGPGGIPLVIDVIQGVFFASHVSVLIEKLRELDIAYNGSRDACRVFFGVASTNFHWYAAGAAVVLVALLFMVFRFWPRRVVHIVFLSGSAARTGARAFGQALKWPLHLRHKRNPTWRLSYRDAEGQPARIEFTQKDLRRAGGSLVIGCDPSCDRCVPVDGVASRHARLVPLGDGIGVADLNSKSGTAVDEKPLTPGDGPAPLPPGARLRLGSVTMNVEQS